MRLQTKQGSICHFKLWLKQSAYRNCQSIYPLQNHASATDTDPPIFVPTCLQHDAISEIDNIFVTYTVLFVN